MGEREAPPQARAFALWPVRLAVSGVMVYHGWEMLGDLSFYARMYGALGIPAPGFFAPLVGVAEFFGGLGILVGVLTRFSSAVLSIVMGVAILVARRGEPFFSGWAFDAVLLGGLLALVLNGPGRPTPASALGMPWTDPEELAWAWARSRRAPQPLL